MNVLYVATDKMDEQSLCPGSTVCMSLVEKLGTNVQVQDCDILKQQTKLPSWLNGTPIFINQEEGVPYRGYDAIKKLREMVRLENERAKTQQVTSTAEKGQMETHMARNALPAQQHPSMQMSPPKEVKPTPPTDKVEDDPFQMDVQPFDESTTSSGKVTEADLQQYMERRKQSPAEANPQTNQP